MKAACIQCEKCGQLSLYRIIRNWVENGETQESHDYLHANDEWCFYRIPREPIVKEDEIQNELAATY